jgi:KipI family sensor histidine kinase inhibitor
MRVLRYGAHALLVECADAQQVAAVCAEVYRRRERGDLPAFDDLVPAELTVLIDGLDDPDPLSHEIPGWGLSDVAAASSRLVELEVRYDGPDLDEVARAWGLTPDQAVEAHTAVEYRVAFCGFTPGFAYLTGLPEQYHLPRRPTPRTSVPAGSVAVAGPYTGVYPRSSPGGWHLIGTTGARLWDLARREPALLTPGTRVAFVPVGRT